MPTHRNKIPAGILFSFLCLLGGLIWTVGTLEVLVGYISPKEGLAEFGQLEQILPQTLAPSSAQVAQTSPPSVTVVTQSSGVTQTFALSPGWNTIYLEVEPTNPSPLVNQGSAENPIMVHEKSTIDAILGNIAGVESIWAWNVPQSTVDYIMDPSEGLWDEAGWKRYIHNSVTGPDGKSQGFLTNLVNLHANTGYLIKMADNAAAVTVTIGGTPKVQHKRWVQNSYNLVGFPLLPSASPTVATFTAGSPLTKIMRLNSAGEWVEMAATDTLAYGNAYLAYHDSSLVTATATNYTAPLDIIDPLPNGLAFLPGLGGRTQSFRIQNLSSAAASDITVKLVGGANVALRLTAPSIQQLTSGNATLTLATGAAAKLDFAVNAVEQPNNGAGLLEISSATLGVRRLVPVTAQSGSMAGLWVGDVTINDVSESRLGATNVAVGNLTVALRSQNDSDIGGRVLLDETFAGSNASVGMTLTLDLPNRSVATTKVLTGTPPYVTGYVFVDLNQNGQRDGDEPGLPNLTVTLAGATTQTGADGSYLFQSVSSGPNAISANLPASYSGNFPLVLPVNYFTQIEVPQFTLISRGTAVATMAGATTTSPNGAFVVSMNQSAQIVISQPSTGAIIWKSPVEVPNPGSASTS